MSHVFMSYDRKDSEKVQLLAIGLKAYGIDVWIDRRSLKAGSRYKNDIKSAIRKVDFFVACFSNAFIDRKRSFANAEVAEALEELRARPVDRTWFVPVRFDECVIPERSIGAGETLRDLHWVDMFPIWHDGLVRIVNVIAPNINTEYHVEVTSAGEVITGNGVVLSSSESEVLFLRYVDQLRKYAKMIGKKNQPKDFWTAHEWSVYQAVLKTYGRLPDEKEFQDGASELIRKIHLFERYAIRMHMDSELQKPQRLRKRAAARPGQRP